MMLTCIRSPSISVPVEAQPRFRRKRGLPVEAQPRFRLKRGRRSAPRFRAVCAWRPRASAAGSAAPRTIDKPVGPLSLAVRECFVR